MMKRFLFIIGVFFFFSLLAVLWYFHLIPQKYYFNEDFGIIDYHSNSDADQDGIDDQMDLLLGARHYVETKPKYQSKYYKNGYPDDEYGVCTDVVGFAFLAAGYDLQKLVSEDIHKYPHLYSISTIDDAIDFRRVRNLFVFLKRHATMLTTNIFEIEEWQGGDIVVFPNHIAIISDRRNRKGISYIIHHGG